MTRSPMIIGAHIHPRMRPLPCCWLAKCGWCDTSAKTCRRFDRTTWMPGLVSSSQVEAHSDHPSQIVEAAPAHDHQAVTLDHLDGATVVWHDSLQLAEDRLDRVLEAQRLPEHLCHGQERLGALSCALNVGDVVVDREEPDMLTVDVERHEHQFHVDQPAVPPYTASDAVRATRLERLAGDVPAFVTKVSSEDDVVDPPPPRLLRRPSEQLCRSRVPARHALVGVHGHACHRADLDERLEEPFSGPAPRRHREVLGGVHGGSIRCGARGCQTRPTKATKSPA